jgi:hypothetical protein
MPKTILSKVQQNPQYLIEAAKNNNRKNNKKKLKYKKICFKITEVQKVALEVMCRRQKTTPVRFLKSVITKQTARYKSIPPPVSYVTENQLALFDLESEVKTKKKK